MVELFYRNSLRSGIDGACCIIHFQHDIVRAGLLEDMYGIGITRGGAVVVEYPFATGDIA